MRTRYFNALNDFLFKFIFGHKENKEIPLSFINAVFGLEGEQAFVDLRFADRAIDPEEESGKGSALDFLCMTNDEIQIKEPLIKWSPSDRRRFFVRTRRQIGRIARPMWRICRHSAGKKDALRWRG